MSLIDEIHELVDDVTQKINESNTSDALENVRVATVGKSGTLTGYLRNMGNVAKEDRAEVGKLVNSARAQLEERLASKKAELKKAEMNAKIAASSVDVTLPGRSPYVGSQHLISNIIDECTDIFLGLGYTVKHGREVETDYYNFTALNAPADHP